MPPLEAVVLAGGFGTRLRAVVADVPKPMAPVAGRPFLEYVLRGLAAHGVQRTVLSVGYMHEKIVAHFGHSFETMVLDYTVETSPLGTGGAVAAALLVCRADPVLVLNGDTWLDLELPALLQQWEQQQAPIIVARQVPDAARYGRLEVLDGRITRFAEKSGSGPGLINAGVYLLPRNIFGAAPPLPPFSIEADFLAHHVQSHRVESFVTRGEFIDIGIPQDFERAQHMALGQRGTMRAPGPDAERPS